MYSELDLEKYAQVAFWALSRARGKAFKKSALIEIRYDLPGLPLAEALVALLHEEGLMPLPRAKPSAAMRRAFLAQANVKRLSMEIPGERDYYSRLDGMIHILAPESMDHLADLDPELLSIAARARQSMLELTGMRERLGDFARTTVAYPSPAAAETAGMSLADYAGAIRSACLLGRGEPVKDWKLFSHDMDELLNRLNSLDIQSLRVQSDGTDLLFRVGRMRRWLGLTGQNMPSYEVYLAPDWRSVEGVFSASLTSQREGNPVERAVLEFVRGEAVKVSAERGLPYALEQLRLDRGANKVGEFSLVDRRFSPIDRFLANTLLDENHGGEHGSCHIALGQAPAESFRGPAHELNRDLAAELGFNRSALHWDLVDARPMRVTATLNGGERMPLYENGQFVA